MFQSNIFDYVRILDKAADASWLRNDAISNNLSNVDTPGYKREDVEFESILKEALEKSHYDKTDQKVSYALEHSSLKAKHYVDYGSFSYRLDKNNVDVENENVILAENQLKYQGLISSINHEFACMQAVMK